MATSGLRGGGAGLKASGLNEQVRAEIGASPDYQRLLNQLYDCIHIMAMNLSEIHVAIGCTWGNHRSVAMVEDLGTSLCDLAPTFDFHVEIWHLERFRWDKNRAEQVDLQWQESTVFSFCA